MFIRSGDTFQVTSWPWEDRDVPPKAELERASREHGEAFYFEFSSSVEGFEYAHWRDGRCVRRLQLKEACFPVQEGEPQPWEWAAFFDWRDAPETEESPEYWPAFRQRHLPTEADGWYRHGLSTKAIHRTLLEYYVGLE